MLTLHARTGDHIEAPVRFDAAALPADIVWADLLNPVAEETAFIERATGLRLPSVEDLSEIETSSRLRTEDGVLYMSAPLVHRATAGVPQSTPVGFVLCPQLLITVRFETLTAFENFARAPRGGAAETFVALLD